GAPIITKSGAPVTVKTAAGSVRAIFFRDPDGYIVEAVQADGPAPEGVTGNVVGAIMGETIGTMETSMKFWRDMMGLPVASVPAFSRDAAMTDLMGLPDGAEFRTVSSVFPGSKARIEFTEFKGAPGTPFSLRVPDPGASGMAIRVADIEGLM